MSFKQKKLEDFIKEENSSKNENEDEEKDNKDPKFHNWGQPKKNPHKW